MSCLAEIVFKTKIYGDERQLIVMLNKGRNLMVDSTTLFCFIQRLINMLGINSTFLMTSHTWIKIIEWLTIKDAVFKQSI